MNPFKEYVDMSLKGLKNIDKVLEGVKNETAQKFKTLSEEKKQIISSRMDICLDCPFSSGNAKTSPEYKELTGQHYDTSRSELHCSLCGCITTFKVAALSSDCGIADWNLNNPGKQLPLKWQAIK